MEYALLVSTIAVVLAGTGGSVARLPGTNAQAVTAVTAAATAAHVSPAAARKALAGAPYRRAQLRYLYAAGWVAGKRERLLCALSRATGARLDKYARDAIRRTPGLPDALRRNHIALQAAVTAVTRGFADSCP